jgi:hypothetical protein
MSQQRFTAGQTYFPDTLYDKNRCQPDDFLERENLLPVEELVRMPKDIGGHTIVATKIAAIRD